MGDRFEPLDCDTDILMVGKDTFTVERLKELLVVKIQNKLNHRIIENQNINMLLCLHSIPVKVIDQYVEFPLNDVQLIFPYQGREAQLLKLGSSQWQTGKLRILALVQTSCRNQEVREVELEFCYDEPLEPESPLDDIRQGEDYQKLINSGS